MLKGLRPRWQAHICTTRVFRSTRNSGVLVLCLLLQECPMLCRANVRCGSSLEEYHVRIQYCSLQCVSKPCAKVCTEYL